MTYSIHDPSKEILYLPTSNAIKFRAKFWIDVVGARVAKAIGSSINTFAGSVDRSVRVGSVPSLLTAGALWFVCYRVGIEFDRLVQGGEIVGRASNMQSDSILERLDYARLNTVEEEDDEHGYHHNGAHDVGLSLDESQDKIDPVGKHEGAVELSRLT
jgi:hypothetical protein